MVRTGCADATSSYFPAGRQLQIQIGLVWCGPRGVGRRAGTRLIERKNARPRCRVKARSDERGGPLMRIAGRCDSGLHLDECVSHLDVVALTAMGALYQERIVPNCSECLRVHCYVCLDHLPCTGASDENVWHAASFAPRAACSRLFRSGDAIRRYVNVGSRKLFLPRWASVRTHRRLSRGASAFQKFRFGKDQVFFHAALGEVGGPRRSGPAPLHLEFEALWCQRSGIAPSWRVSSRTAGGCLSDESRSSRPTISRTGPPRAAGKIAGAPTSCCRVISWQGLFGSNPILAEPAILRIAGAG